MDTAFNQYLTPKEALKYSINYLKYIYFKNRTDCFVNSNNLSQDCLFDRIVSEYSGEVRDRAIVFCLLRDYYNSNDLNNQIEKAYKIIKTPYCLDALQRLNVRRRGMRVDNFILQDINGRMVNTAIYNDKIVVVDFWYTGCGWCSTLYHNILSKVEKKYEDDSTVVFLSISIDKSRDVWKQSIASGLYTSQRAINLYTNGETYNSSIIKYFNVTSYPTLIVLNNGRIAAFNTAEIKYQENYLMNFIKNLLALNKGT